MTTEKPYTPMRPGNETSEYKQAKGAGWVGIIAMIVGLLTAYLPGLMDGMAKDGKAYAICGIVLAIGGLVTKTLTTLGYIKGRNDLKVPLAEAAKSQSQAALVNAQRAAIEASKKGQTGESG